MVTGYVVVVVPLVASTPMAETSSDRLSSLVASGVTRARWPTATLPMSATATSVVSS